MRRREFITLIGGTAALSALPRAAAALDYPTRPVHWIAGFPPGGATDILARLTGLMAIRAARPVIRHRQSAGRRQQHRPSQLQFRPRYRPSREHQPRAQPDGGAPLGIGT